MKSAFIIKSDDLVFSHGATDGAQQLFKAMAERTQGETGVAEVQIVRAE